MKLVTLVTALLLLPALAAAEPLPYSVSRKLMYSEVFYDHRETLYCGASYDEHREVTLPDGFVVSSHAKRANRAETEHIVPAENFGRTFREWREGYPLCVHSDGQPFKGRRCAQFVNDEYRLMEADLSDSLLMRCKGSLTSSDMPCGFQPRFIKDSAAGSAGKEMPRQGKGT